MIIHGFWNSNFKLFQRYINDIKKQKLLGNREPLSRLGGLYLGNTLGNSLIHFSGASSLY